MGGDSLLRRSRATLARRLDAIAPAGPVLDVGSGEGALLDALHARGRVAIGLERETNRPDVRAGDIGEFDERQGEWAAVVFWHSLEHLREPGAAIDRAVGLLKPGGALVVAVPNFASWQARRFGDRWFALDIPRHLVHLKASALLAGLSDRGLTVGRVSHWRAGQAVFGWLDGLVGTLPGGASLYDAIRRPEARSASLTAARRAKTLVEGVALAPAALGLAGAEVLARRGGTVYVEASR
jgi:2-polyprenyl-3-methyl-5-hydroxy-6-metoxy-1,4-benzoquinol methylase